MAKVYVSSTVADLTEERRAVPDWLRLARHQPVDSYLPGSDTVRDSCLADVGGCDLYALIVGHRYGSQPPQDNPEGLSITQLEFRRAGECGIPRVALLRTSIPDVRAFLPRMLVADRGSAEGLPVDDAARQRPGRRRGFFGEFAAAVKRGSAMPMSGAPPAGRAERLRLVPVPPGGGQAEALPSRIVHGGRRHTIGGELAGDWDGRPAIVCDLQLDTDYGARGDALPGIVSGRFHIAALGLRRSYPWYAITRQDIREHLDGAGNGTRLPGAGMLGGVRLLADHGAPPLPAPVLEWVGRDAIAKRTGHAQVSAVELAGPWALAALPVATMEHSDEHAAALAARLGRPELAPWPEQLLGLLREFAGRLE